MGPGKSHEVVGEGVQGGHRGRGGRQRGVPDLQGRAQGQLVRWARPMGLRGCHQDQQSGRSPVHMPCRVLPCH